MKEDLLDIRAGIKAGRYVNEATVSQGIVQRLLHSLGWPVYDTEVVAPEYSLGGRRADYALCHPPSEPVILIEVKQVGQSKGADACESVLHSGGPSLQPSADSIRAIENRYFYMLAGYAIFMTHGMSE